jgi:hypothetical protein
MDSAVPKLICSRSQGKLETRAKRPEGTPRPHRLRWGRRRSFRPPPSPLDIIPIKYVRAPFPPPDGYEQKPGHDEGQRQRVMVIFQLLPLRLQPDLHKPADGFGQRRHVRLLFSPPNDRRPNHWVGSPRWPARRPCPPWATLRLLQRSHKIFTFKTN